MAKMVELDPCPKHNKLPTLKFDLLTYYHRGRGRIYTCLDCDKEKAKRDIELQEEGRRNAWNNRLKWSKYQVIFLIDF